jgi:hypothetical protein
MSKLAGAVRQGQCSGSAKASRGEPSRPGPETERHHSWPTSATALSGHHHRRRAGWHNDDRPVRVGDIGHVDGMDVHHDQEERDHGQRADQQRGEKPGVDFDCPIHNESQHIGPGAGPLGRSKCRHLARWEVRWWWHGVCVVETMLQARGGRQTAERRREVDRARESEQVAQLPQRVCPLRDVEAGMSVGRIVKWLRLSGHRRAP